MWQPSERIRHPLPSARWPSADEAAASRWFSPIRLGPVELEQRTWIPAMVPWRATEDGHVTPEVLGWYERFAAGRPGAIVVEATGVRDIPSGPLLRAGDDRFLPGLRELVETVRNASGGHARLFIQLIDFLAVKRRVAAETFFERFFVVTDRHRELLGDRAGSDDDIRRHLLAADTDELERVLDERELEALRFGYRERVTDVHLEHVRRLPDELPDTFARAAARCEAAGFDGVELHCAHAYTLAGFLSRRNDRTDGYGSTLAGRARLPLEVFHAVRSAVPPSFAVGCRFLTEECIDGGSTVDDAVAFGVDFARAGLDFVSLSRGGKFEDAKQPAVGRAVYPYTGRSGYECMPTVISDAAGPFGRNVEATARIRAAIRAEGFETPVVVAGGIATFEHAESLLERGAADVVGAARQSLADPDWFRKVHVGRGDEVRRCEFTNYCEGLDQMHKQVTCKLWDRAGLDDDAVARSSDGRRRLTAPKWE